MADSYITGLDQLAAQQKKAAKAALTASRDKALASLSNEQAKIAPLYQAQKNETASQAMLGAKNFAEYMAGNGLSTGTGAQWDMMNNNQLTGSLNSLGKEQAQAEADILKQRAQVQSDFNTNLGLKYTDIETARLEQELSYLQSRRGGGGGGNKSNLKEPTKPTAPAEPVKPNVNDFYKRYYSDREFAREEYEKALAKYQQDYAVWQKAYQKYQKDMDDYNGYQQWMSLLS